MFSTCQGVFEGVKSVLQMLFSFLCLLISPVYLFQSFFKDTEIGRKFREKLFDLVILYAFAYSFRTYSHFVFLMMYEFVMESCGFPVVSTVPRFFTLNFILCCSITYCSITVIYILFKKTQVLLTRHPVSDSTYEKFIRFTIKKCRSVYSSLRDAVYYVGDILSVIENRLFGERKQKICVISLNNNDDFMDISTSVVPSVIISIFFGICFYSFGGDFNPLVFV